MQLLIISMSIIFQPIKSPHSFCLIDPCRECLILHWPLMISINLSTCIHCTYLVHVAQTHLLLRWVIIFQFGDSWSGLNILSPQHHLIDNTVNASDLITIINSSQDFHGSQIFTIVRLIFISDSIQYWNRSDYRGQKALVQIISIMME